MSGLSLMVRSIELVRFEPKLTDAATPHLLLQRLLGKASFLSLANNNLGIVSVEEFSERERADFERLKSGLKQTDITLEQSRELFFDLSPGLLEGDLAFTHNMGLLAAQSSLADEAYAIGIDMMENGHPSSTVAIAARGLDWMSPNEAPVYHKMLRKVARLGHLRARSLLWEYKLRKLGSLRYLVLLPIRLGMAANGFIIALIDPDDIRLENGLYSSPPFRKK